jgi:octaheme c-type cytochrome (tetrathionate reductase family)
MLKSVHWTWERKQVVNGKEMEFGKINAVNNFCGATKSNRDHCSMCHAGYGWKDASFNFKDPTHIDCLICHDTTGTYKKDEHHAGAVGEGVNLLFVAQHVGKPVREDCGACHFDGGGGDGVKHGDLDSSLSYPDRSEDVHMAADGLNFECQDCHSSDKHNILGSDMATSPDGHGDFGCAMCHGDQPHKESRLNKHTATVACETCHIPEMARVQPTQMSWDWSTAGQNKAPAGVNGKTIRYIKSMGTQTWATMVQPTYAWFNGKSGVYVRGEKIDPNKVTDLCWPKGDIHDKTAKIFPFKVHTGKQIYDTVNDYFIVNHVYDRDNKGFWQTFDWNESAAAGMKDAGLPYSGHYGFAPTKMYWRLDHMVAPKEQALQCLDCHGDHGRMDWKALGYQGDPMTNHDWARNP